MSRYERSNTDYLDENFLKDLLSFMYDSDDSSGSSGYDSDIFLAIDVATSGHFNSFSSKRVEDLIYRRCNFSDRLNVSWTKASTGLISSVSELELREELSIPQCSFSSSPIEDKASFFAKSLKNLLLLEIENHPERLRHTKRVNSQPKLITTAKSSISTKANSICQLKPDEKQENTVPPETQLRKYCRFCLKNREPAVVHTGHVLKAPDGSVVCPILRRYVCDICGATGANSHTRKYCPVYNKVA